MQLTLQQRSALLSAWARIAEDIPPAKRKTVEFENFNAALRKIGPRIGTEEHAQLILKNRAERENLTVFVASSPEIGGERLIIGWPELVRITGYTRNTLVNRFNSGRGSFDWNIKWTFPITIEKLLRTASPEEVESYKPWVVNRTRDGRTELEFPQ